MVDFSNCANKVSDIAVYLRTPWCTINKILNNFIAADHSLESFTFKSRRFANIRPDVKEFLLSPSTLKVWMPYNLKERSCVLTSLFNCRVSASQL